MHVYLEKSFIVKKIMSSCENGKQWKEPSCLPCLVSLCNNYDYLLSNYYCYFAGKRETYRHLPKQKLLVTKQWHSKMAVNEFLENSLLLFNHKWWCIHVRLSTNSVNRTCWDFMKLKIVIMHSATAFTTPFMVISRTFQVGCRCT